jgi:glycine cleavage system H protein
MTRRRPSISDPYGAGWMIKLKMAKAGEADAMLSAEEYEEYLSASAV